ncbi:MAG: 2-hydroxy-3-oxopropionate reductase [Propionibacteriaceae bacterium]|jgi:2-hydroxy-3-oxopropionate reductase|nr:2-hydroxy-3-oxopropionate reductase [Propionibacteriaceae bacterium]
MRIGFIGLGVMGQPMAANLIKAGHQLVVSNRSRPAVDALVALGATAAEGGVAVASQVDLVITMLPNSPEVRSVLLGEGGVIEAAHEGLTVVDMSSIDPIVARDVAGVLAGQGVTMLDAPVSGGEPGAIAGTLSIMVGGPESAFDRVKPVLAAMGSSVVRVGDIGAGNIAKLANQAIVAVNIAVLAEALVLAQKAGVEPAAVVSAIAGGLAGSNVMTAKAPMMLDHQFTPGFRVALHHKDLTNVIAAAHSVAAPMPLAAAAFEQLNALMAQGFGGEDHSALLRLAEQAAATTLNNHESTGETA